MEVIQASTFEWTISWSQLMAYSHICIICTVLNQSGHKLCICTFTPPALWFWIINYCIPTEYAIILHIMHCIYCPKSFRTWLLIYTPKPLHGRLLARFVVRTIVHAQSKTNPHILWIVFTVQNKSRNDCIFSNPIPFSPCKD